METEPLSEEEKKYLQTSQERDRGIFFMRTSSFASHLSSLGVNSNADGGASSFSQSVSSLLFSLILSSLVSIWKVFFLFSKVFLKEIDTVCFSSS